MCIRDSNYSRCFNYEGEYKLALEKLLPVFETVKSQLTVDHPLTLSIQLEIAYVHRKLHQDDEAIEEYQKVKELSKRSNNGETELKMKAIHGIALCQMDKGEYYKASQP